MREKQNLNEFWCLRNAEAYWKSRSLLALFLDKNSVDPNKSP